MKDRAGCFRPVNCVFVPVFLITNVLRNYLFGGTSHAVDRGVQYASTDFRDALRVYGFIQSMGRKGNCYDNAVAESIFHKQKTEHAYDYRYETRAAARQSIFEYIEMFYNRHRRHSALGYHSPVSFELEAIAAQPNRVSTKQGNARSLSLSQYAATRIIYCLWNNIIY